MCLWVERAHLRELVRNVHTTLERLRDVAPERAQDMLFNLPPRIATAAIIFRDFPKTHGNIIQKAVGIALEHHPGGFTQTAARFSFLSGLQVEVDNFFMTRKGQIYLFETKRDYDKIREEGVAGRALWDVKQAIEIAAASRTGRTLRYPIEISYFSYANDAFDGGPRPLTVNIGTPSNPQPISMPVYSRQDMNNLIGPCFGEYLRLVDVEVGKAISEVAPELGARGQQDVDAPASEGANRFMKIGEPPIGWDLNVSDILA